MGTHRYIVEAVAGENPGKEDVQFLVANPYATNNPSNFGSNTGEVARFLISHGCREALVHHAEAYLPTFRSKLRKNKDVLIGYRMFGEQYSAVAILLKNYGVAKFRTIFPKVMETAFGIKLSCEFGLVSKTNTAQKLPVMRHIEYTDSSGKLAKKPNHLFVTIYLKLSENKRAKLLPIVISTISAILREPMVIQKIMDNEVTDANSLAKALTQVSVERANARDSGYHSVSFSGGNRMEPLMTNTIRNNLARSSSSDGSDWYSILKLATFVYYFSSQQFVGNRGINGPVNYMADHWNPSFLQNFRRDVLDNSLASSIKTVEKKRRLSGGYYSPTNLENAMS